jgi:hypothetical protein
VKSVLTISRNAHRTTQFLSRFRDYLHVLPSYPSEIAHRLSTVLLAMNGVGASFKTL